MSYMKSMKFSPYSNNKISAHFGIDLCDAVLKQKEFLNRVITTKEKQIFRVWISYGV